MSTSTKEIFCQFFRHIARVPLNIAPERAQELTEEIFGPGKWKLLPSEAEANFYAVPAEKAIYCSYAGLASLWCVAYAAFHVSDIGSQAQRAPEFSERTEVNIAEECAARKVSQHVAYARELLLKDQVWPEEFKPPALNSDFSSLEGRVNNVFFGALSWILLHEIAHLHNGDEKLLPADLLIRQEYIADGFATSWILSEAGNGLKREFRVLMIIVALTWLFLFEQMIGPGKDHPPAILRFREASALFKLSSRSVGLENAYYVLKALLDPATPGPQLDNAKELFEWMSVRLETLFPVN